MSFPGTCCWKHLSHREVKLVPKHLVWSWALFRDWGKIKHSQFRKLFVGDQVPDTECQGYMLSITGVKGTAAIQGQGRRADLRGSLLQTCLSFILANKTETAWYTCFRGAKIFSATWIFTIIEGVGGLRVKDKHIEPEGKHMTEQQWWPVTGTKRKMRFHLPVTSDWCRL